MFQAVDKHSKSMFGCSVRIAIKTGMRLSEIATLRIRQMDADRRVARLDHTKKFSPRTILLTAEATRLFTKALANTLGPCDIRRPYLFGKACINAKCPSGLAKLSSFTSCGMKSSADV